MLRSASEISQGTRKLVRTPHGINQKKKKCIKFSSCFSLFGCVIDLDYSKIWFSFTFYFYKRVSIHMIFYYFYIMYILLQRFNSNDTITIFLQFVYYVYFVAISILKSHIYDSTSSDTFSANLCDTSNVFINIL